MMVGRGLFLVKKETSPVKIIRVKENKAFRLGMDEGFGGGSACSKATLLGGQGKP